MEANTFIVCSVCDEKCETKQITVCPMCGEIAHPEDEDYQYCRYCKENTGFEDIEVSVCCEGEIKEMSLTK